MSYLAIQGELLFMVSWGRIEISDGEGQREDLL